MTTDHARKIVAALDEVDRRQLNLTNAAAMPNPNEDLLCEAGISYVAAVQALNGLVAIVPVDPEALSAVQKVQITDGSGVKNVSVTPPSPTAA